MQDILAVNDTESAEFNGALPGNALQDQWWPATQSPENTEDDSTILTSNLTVSQGQELDLQGNGYEVAADANVSLYDAGTIKVEGTDQSVTGFAAPHGDDASSEVWIQSTGTFDVTGPDDVFGISGNFQTPEVINDGVLHVTSQNGDAWGLYTAGKTIENTGQLLVEGVTGAAGVVAGTCDFANSGAISATSSSGYVDGVSLDGFSEDSSFVNSGTIDAKVKSTSGQSFGVIFFASQGETPVLHNSGEISGEYAFIEYQYPAYVDLMQIVNSTIDNTGTLNGATDLGYGNDTVNNAGTINGYVALGQGNDTYNGTDGEIHGKVYGGFGNDILIGGANDDKLYGEEGNDTLYGGGGHDILDGGDGNDKLYGGSGNDVLYGGYGKDILHGGSGDNVLDGGMGADDLYCDSGKTTIVEPSAVYSFGSSFDTIHSFDFSRDTIRIESIPTILDPTVVGGTLSKASFASDLTNLLPAAALDAHGAVLVEPNAGQYAGDTFLVLDDDGEAGYQDGQDIVLRLDNSVNLDALSLSDFVQGKSTYHPLSLTFNSSIAWLGGPGRALYGDFTIHPGESAKFDFSDLYGNDAGFSEVTMDGMRSKASTITNEGDILVGASVDETISGIRQASDTTKADYLTVVNAVDGKITVEDSSGGASVGISASSVTNNGRISATNFGSATGIVGGTVNNTGEIDVDGHGGATGIALGSSADNSGTIIVKGSLYAAYGVSFGNDLRPVSFTNEGTIEVSDSTHGQESIAVDALAEYGATRTFTNTGFVHAEYVYLEEQGATTPTDARTIINNSGTMDGKIDTAYGDDQVTNTGTIVGNIELGSGNDVYDGAGGTHTGTVYGGAGDDTLVGGLGNDTLNGGSGNDHITAGTGNETLTGGTGEDQFNFGTKFGDDTITDFAASGTHDVIEFATSDFANFTALEPHMAQVGNDVVITLNDHEMITLNHVSLASLVSGDFLFG